MLETTIRNSDILSTKTWVEPENRGLEDKKPTNEDKNHGLKDKKPLIEDKNRLFEVVEKAVSDRRVTSIVAKNVKEVISAFETNQIWRRKEIKNELKYGDSKAGKTIKDMQLLDLITPVAGRGKGKYMLKKFD